MPDIASADAAIVATQFNYSRASSMFVMQPLTPQACDTRILVLVPSVLLMLVPVNPVAVQESGYVDVFYAKIAKKIALFHECVTMYVISSLFTDDTSEFMWNSGRFQRSTPFFSGYKFPRHCCRKPALGMAWSARLPFL